MKIILLTPSGLNIPLVDVETVDDIKNIIKFKFITVTSTTRLRLIFDGKCLDHAKSLADYKIRDGSIIYYYEVGFQIFVRNLSGKTITIDDNHSCDTIEHVMEKIEKKNGLPSWDQLLVHAGKQLQEELTLAYYGIEKDSTLFMVSRLRSYSAMEDDFDVLPLKLRLPVKTSDTIDVLKTKIMNEFLLPKQPERLSLAFNGNVLDNNTSTLMGNNIQVGSVIDLTLAPPPWVRKRKRGSNEEENEDAKKKVCKRIHLICEMEEEKRRRREKLKIEHLLWLRRVVYKIGQR